MQQSKLSVICFYSTTASLTVEILTTYYFVGITERMYESAVVLSMLLNVPLGDLLYLTAKRHGGYDDAGSRNGSQCTFIWAAVHFHRHAGIYGLC
jgi:hypothetical protein